MKPSPLIKIFVSGLMASAFLLTAACDNASRRAVKAFYDPKAQSLQKPTDANTACNKDISDAIDDRVKTITPINASLDAAAHKPLTADEKKALQDLIQALKPKTAAVIKEINSARVDDKPITGCYIKDEKTGKKTSYSIQLFQIEDTLLAKRVKVVTGQTNDIVEQAAKDKDLTAQVTMSQNQVYQASNLLLSQMSPDDIDGRMYVLDGEVKIGPDAQDELKSFTAEKKKSVCWLVTSTEKPTAEARLKVKTISETLGADGKSSEAQILFGGEKDDVFTVKCSLAVAGDAGTQVRSVFAGLITLDQSYSANSATNSGN